MAQVEALIDKAIASAIAKMKPDVPKASVVAKKDKSKGGK